MHFTLIHNIMINIQNQLWILKFWSLEIICILAFVIYFFK